MIMRRGFSLVELSIVLVVLGLLAGGVMVGQNIFRAAELRGVVAEIGRYQTATFAFIDSYKAWPGDMKNAVTYWGAQAGSTADGVNATCRDLTTASTTSATCNGNGNSYTALNEGEQFEAYRAWQHLANAGLTEGGFSGVTTSTSNSWGSSVRGENKNSPSSKISGAGYTFRAYPAITNPDTNLFVGNYGNLLMFGFPSAGTTIGPVVSPEEAESIDKKMDDAKPAFGDVLVPRSQTNCHTSTTPSLSEYNVSQGAVACGMYFLFETTL